MIIMTEILLIRHGETEYNKTGRFVGSSDICLNDTGLEQALKLKTMLSDESIDKIYSSDLKRCVETGSGIVSSSLIYSESLREMDFGRWEGLTYGEIKEKYYEELELWKNDWTDYRITGGESFRDMADRVLKKFDEIIISLDGQENKVAIITHGGCIRALLGHFIIGSFKDSWKFQVDNAAISRLSLNKDYYYLKSLNER
jgi:alpha-ribazole phosphatase